MAVKNRHSLPGARMNNKIYRGGWKMRKAQAGFTLIELMVVVAVISVLAALAIAAYQDYLARTQMSEAINLASGSKSSVAEFLTNRGYYPPNNVSAGLADPVSIVGKYVTYVSVINGRIRARIKDIGVAPGIEGEFVELSPISRSSTTGSLEWKCFSDAPAKYMPTACRDF
jgi:type IV pilus assembly protein PilA